MAATASCRPRALDDVVVLVMATHVHSDLAQRDVGVLAFWVGEGRVESVLKRGDDRAGGLAGPDEQISGPGHGYLLVSS